MAMSSLRLSPRVLRKAASSSIPRRRLQLHAKQSLYPRAGAVLTVRSSLHLSPYVLRKAASSSIPRRRLQLHAKQNRPLKDGVVAMVMSFHLPLTAALSREGRFSMWKKMQ
jgi:hypothetical protein